MDLSTSNVDRNSSSTQSILGRRFAKERPRLLRIFKLRIPSNTRE